MERAACRLKFRKRTIMSCWRGQIDTLELEEEVQKKMLIDREIETGQGVRTGKTLLLE